MRFQEYKEDPLNPFLRKVAQVESGGNPAAKNPTSSATGLYQFTDSTWKGVVNQLGLKYNLEDRKDPKKADLVMREFTRLNESYIKPVVGRELNDADRHLGHFLGAGGARTFFKGYNAEPNAPVSSVLSPGAIKANKSVVYNKDGSLKTIGQLYDWASAKMNIKVGSTTTALAEPVVDLYTPPDTTQNLSSLPDTEEKPTLADTSQEDAKKRLEEKMAERNYIAKIIGNTAVDYVDPAQYQTQENFMQKGGTITVKDKNDPRYKSYQDSLMMYNEGVNANDRSMMTNGKPFKYWKDQDASDMNPRDIYFQQKTGIAPIGHNLYNNTQGNGTTGSVIEYPVYKKPVQPVILQSDIIQSPPEIKALPPMTPEGLVPSDFELEGDMGINNPVRTPQYWNIEDTIQGSTNYNGSQTNYRFDGAQELPYISPNNTRTVTPVYQRGGATRQDSLDIYNNSVGVLKYYKDKNYAVTDRKLGRQSNVDLHNQNDRFYKYFKDNGSIIPVAYIDKDNKEGKGKILNSNYRKNIDDNIYLQREAADALLDLRSPMQKFDRRIEPTLQMDLRNVSSKDRLFGDAVQLIGYDPISVKPYNLLTETEKKERLKKYGTSGTPYQQLNPKPSPVIQKREGYVPLKTMTPEDLITNNFELEGSVDINNPIRVPQYWNIQDNIQGSTAYNGSQTNYRFDGSQDLPYIAPTNTRIVTPVYQQGGLINSDLGQWMYPGEITQINSNEITMKPNPLTGEPIKTPVLGISDTGHIQMMYPGENYKFNGNSVTEYPQIKKK